MMTPQQIESLLMEHDAILRDLQRYLLHVDDEPRLNHPGRPTRDEVRVHFASCGRTDDAADAQGFYDRYESQNWVSGTGQPITNWKAKASEWMRRNARAELPETATNIPNNIPIVRDPVIEERRELEQRAARGEFAPMPDSVRTQLAALGIGVKRNPNVRPDSDLERTEK